jgi:uncharacterized membrane protein
MLDLILGLVLFLGVHSVSIVSPAWRDRMAARLGEWTWKGLYSLVALGGLVLIVWGYGTARLDPTFLYFPPDWLRHVSFLLLLPVFPLLLAAYLPGRVQRTLKHPMLVAVKAWALAHLLVNGTLADVLLFGGFLVWAGVDRMSLKRRTPRPVPSLPAGRWNDAVAVVGGLAIYVGFALWAHEWLIGVPVR